MVQAEYKIAYSEVLEILKHISTEKFNKIPKDMIEMFKENASNENDFTYNSEKTLQEQNVSETARAIIAILFRDYWATEIQREKILAKQSYDREKLKEQLYNTDNLFKNRVNTTQKINENLSEETAIVEYKEKNFIQKLFDKIKLLLKRN